VAIVGVKDVQLNYHSKNGEIVALQDLNLTIKDQGVCEHCGSKCDAAKVHYSL